MFLVFAWTEGHPLGGIDDLAKVCSTACEAQKFIEQLKPINRRNRRTIRWAWHVVELPSLETISDSDEHEQMMENFYDC